jgi:hypothetical protein
MRRVSLACLLLALLTTSALAQKPKPWTEWTEKEAIKILNDSGWGQTQTETKEAGPSPSSAITSVMAPGAANRNLSNAGRDESGQPKADTSVRFRGRLLSAKPVRAAFARMLLLMKQQPDEQLTAQLDGFVNRDFADYVVVALNVEGADQRMVSGAMQLLSAATADTLKDKVYLERKDGKKLVLTDYRPPGPDGMGAKFVFMRKLEGQPFLTADSDSVKFVALFNEKVKLNLRYKVSDMLYEGNLEY